MTRTPAGDQFTRIVLEVFRLHGALVATGDQLVEDLGLSTARWQVLGMVVDQPLTVSGIARRMGLTRQSVQRTADRLVEDGYLCTRQNPDHRSAKLYGLTSMGVKVMAKVTRRQAAWANRLAEGMEPKAFAATEGVLQKLFDRLDAELGSQEMQS